MKGSWGTDGKFTSNQKKMINLTGRTLNKAIKSSLKKPSGSYNTAPSTVASTSEQMIVVVIICILILLVGLFFQSDRLIYPSLIVGVVCSVVVFVIKSGGTSEGIIDRQSEMKADRLRILLEEVLSIKPDDNDLPKILQWFKDVDEINKELISLGYSSAERLELKRVAETAIIEIEDIFLLGGMVNDLLKKHDQAQNDFDRKKYALEVKDTYAKYLLLSGSDRKIAPHITEENKKAMENFFIENGVS